MPRLGFSGTPSELMPRELGQCEYEPGSEGEAWGMGRTCWSYMELSEAQFRHVSAIFPF